MTLAPALARKALLLTFDVEELDWPVERGRRLRIESQMRATARGVRRILPVLERHRVSATFFITGELAHHRPDTVRRIVEAGHEAAVHGLAHADDYARMDERRAVQRLSRARALVEAVSGRPALGMRTPRLQPCPARLLRAAGFAYDASPHPTWVPGRYNGLRLPRSPWEEEGVLRVPISVLPGLRAPVSWIWYRSLGSRLGLLGARLAARQAVYLQLYFHPWEAVELRVFGIPWWLAARTGKPFLCILDRLLTVCSDMDAMPIEQFVRSWRTDVGMQ